MRKGSHLSEETKEKIRLKLLGKPLSEETKLKMSQARMGHAVSDETKRKISKAHIGMGHTEETKKKLGELNRNRVVSDETRKKHSQYRGPKGANWKGGLTSVNLSIRESGENKRWIRECLERDDFTCQKCGVRGVKLHVHHKKTIKELMEEVTERIPLFSVKQAAQVYRPFWNIDNGITLCVGCHRKIHREKAEENRYAA